jgi:hypothetical protein
MPREILSADSLLSKVERGLARVADKPALIVWGKSGSRKGATPPAVGTHLPHHRTQILRGAEHDIQEDAPDEIIAAITDWWLRTSFGSQLHRARPDLSRSSCVCVVRARGPDSLVHRFCGDSPEFRFSLSHGSRQ